MIYEAKKYSILFAILQAAFWASNCILYGYIVNILTAYGFSTYLSGLVLTFIALATIFIQPLLGFISDTFLTPKKLLLICFSLAAVLTALMPIFMKMGALIPIIIIILISIFDYAFYTVIDVWAVRIIAQIPGMDFGIIRSGGSIGYAVTAIIAGNVIMYFWVDVLFYGHTALLLICMLTAIFIKDMPCPNSKKYIASDMVHSPKGDSLFSTVKQLVSNRKYMIAVIMLALFQVCSRVTQSYMSKLIEHFNGTSSDMGIALFIGSALEVAFMIFVGKRIAKGSSLTYIYASFNLVMVLRMVVLLIPGGVIVPIVTQLFQAMSMGIYLRVFPDYIESITPKHLTATACTFAIAMSMGAGSVPGNLLGGALIDEYGMLIYIIISAAIGLLGSIVFLPNVYEEYKLRKNKQQCEAN